MASCARYRTSFTVPELLEPDAIYEIRCGPRRVFLPGHRIRLEVSSSNFPRFDRNSNTGEEIASEAAIGRNAVGDYYLPYPCLLLALGIEQIGHELSKPALLWTFYCNLLKILYSAERTSRR